MSDHTTVARPDSDLSSESLNLSGALLSKVMVQLRRDRVPYGSDQTFYVRTDDAMGGAFAQVWFQTRGCTWDRRGACTMCNYGQAASVDAQDMISFVRQALESIDDELAELYVSPSGSLLDPREVPEVARNGIYELVNQFPVGRFSFETRAETVTPAVVNELSRSIQNKKVAVGFGLETADPWILRFCVNKPGQRAAFTRAAHLLNDAGIGVYANVSLGTAFLALSEAIDDAVKTVEWALRNGADLAIIFPMHIKSHTLLAWLHERERYEPPSLWALIEVLKSIDPELVPRVTISWYRSDYGDEQSIVASPSTCQACESDVLEALDAFRANASSDAVRNLSLLECVCRAAWRASLLEGTYEPLPARIAENYEAIASEFGLEDWWAAHSDGVCNELIGE